MKKLLYVYVFLLFLLVCVFFFTRPASAGGFASANGFAFCSAADVGSTIAAVQNGAEETNPLWRHSVNQHHYGPLVVGNLALVGLAYRYEDRISPDFFLGFNLLRCLVAGANLRFVF